MNLGRKLLILFLIVILFSLVVSLLFMSEIYDFGFYIVVYFIYVVLLIFLIGLFLLIVVDFLLNKIRFINYVFYLIVKLLSYVCVGFVGMCIFYLVIGVRENIFNFKEMFFLILFGVFVVMIFVLVDFGLEVFFKVCKK